MSEGPDTPYDNIMKALNEIKAVEAVARMTVSKDKEWTNDGRMCLISMNKSIRDLISTIPTENQYDTDHMFLSSPYQRVLSPTYEGSSLVTSTTDGKNKKNLTCEERHYFDSQKRKGTSTKLSTELQESVKDVDSLSEESGQQISDSGEEELKKLRSSRPNPVQTAVIPQQSDLDSIMKYVQYQQPSLYKRIDELLPFQNHHISRDDIVAITSPVSDHWKEIAVLYNMGIGSVKVSDWDSDNISLDILWTLLMKARKYEPFYARDVMWTCCKLKITYRMADDFRLYATLDKLKRNITNFNTDI